MNEGKFKGLWVIKSLALVLVLATLIITPFGLGGCKVNIGYVGTNVGNRIVAAYTLFNDTETATIDVDAGKTLIVNYTSDVKQGKLTIKIFNSADELVAELPSNTTGTKSIYTASHEKYKLEVAGDGTEGSFNVSWETQ